MTRPPAARAPAPPGGADTLYPRAFAAYRAGDLAIARKLLLERLASAPEDAQSLLLLGVVTEEADHAPCLALVEQAAFLDPTDASAWYNLGVYEGKRNALEGAMRAYQRAVALDPLHLDALGNGCEMLRRLEYFDEALTWADRLLSLGRDIWSSYLNRAVCLYHLRRFRDADADFAKAKSLAPDRPIIDWESFSLRLHERRFAEAWDAFENRFAAGHLNGVFAYPFPEPLWRGEDLAGKHILVHNEQGLGDQIMFACALAEVVAAAERVTVVVAPELQALFAASFPKASVLPARYGRFAGDHPEPPWLSSLAKVDFQIPIGGLMARLRRTEQSFKAPARYLRPSHPARARWRAIDLGKGLKVGVCWASNPALFRMDSARRARRKSMPLSVLAPILRTPGATFISILNWPLGPEAAAAGGRLRDLSVNLTSLDETAALIEGLDLVITVDTAVAHLAGALGKETWLMLHDFPDCRWGLVEDRSYWYRDMRLFRQTTLGDWTPVIAEVGAALAARIAAGSAG